MANCYNALSREMKSFAALCWPNLPFSPAWLAEQEGRQSDVCLGEGKEKGSIDFLCSFHLRRTVAVAKRSRSRLEHRLTAQLFLSRTYYFISFRKLSCCC